MQRRDGYFLTFAAVENRYDVANIIAKPTLTFSFARVINIQSRFFMV